MDAPNPTFLEELADCLDRVKTAWDRFCNDAFAVYRRLARFCHLGGFRGPVEKANPGAASKRFSGRRELAEPQTVPPVIASGGRQYTIIKQLAPGDLADLHLAASDHVEYVLKISRPAAGNLLLAAEARRLKALASRNGDRCYREFIPQLVESFLLPRAVGGRQVNVFTHRPGFFTLDAVRQRHPAGLDGRHLAWVFKRMLAILGFAHGCGFVHGAVLPPHVMIHAENHGLQLVDWIHAVPLGQRLDFVPTAYRDWFPPEALARGRVGPATDIYLAAKCLIYLGGGDPVAERWPATMPQPMRQFLETCLYPAPRMRPQDAWKLHEEFDALLLRLFGSPKYHRLVMA